MIRRLDKLIRPDEFYSDLLQIDFESFYQRGFRLIMLDVDNTLARHGSQQPDDYARQVIARIQAAQLKCWIISNGGERRVSHYAATLNVPGIPMAKKPSRRALRFACQSSGVQPSQAVMIGDQLFTDIISAHRTGCRAVLVQPRFEKEGWNIKIKRQIEKLISRKYKTN